MLALWFLFLVGYAEGLPLCSPPAEPLQVTTTEEARALASALNCSGGGSFDVLWQGTVVVDETIVVLTGASLNIVDAGSGAVDAVASGNGSVQLFTLSSGASLNATGLHFVNGTRAIQAFESVVTLRDATFKGNSAFSGGAIDAYNSSFILSGETLFDSNDAYYGGAVWSEGERSVFSWSGNTTFRNNLAIENGGALLVRDGSVSWSGDTSFEYNTGRWSGPGALSAEGTTEVSWSGTTVFEGNSGSTGGAIFCGGQASATGSGNTTFKDNVSGTSGGAVYALCNFSFSGTTSFATNTAGNDGGGISARGGRVEWEGETCFSGNTANFSGGALSVPGGSDVIFGGLTTLVSNTAVEAGGAVWAFPTSLFDDVSATIVFASGSNTSFDQNQAGVYGGAMFVGGSVSVEFGGSNATAGTAAAGVSFTLNNAATSGGAVHVSSVARGLTWVNVTFTSNSAEIGGAVYSVASGTFVVQDASGQIASEYPTVFIGGLFRDNSAVNSGGALESAAGTDIFQGTLFMGNSAAIGGALRLSGVADLIDCDFVGNSVTDDGAAVANLGGLSVQNCSFADMVLICEPDTFLDYDEQGDSYGDICVGCPECSGCEVDMAGSMTCEAQFEHSVSGGYPVVLETLQVERGFWRATNTSTIFLPCYNKDACVGGITGSPGYCEEGYSGPYCSACTGGYAAAVMYTCSNCSNNRGLVFGVVVLVIALLLLVAVIFYLTKKELGVGAEGTTADRGRAWGTLHRLKHLLPLHALKIIVVVWQILTQFDAVANVTYAGVWGQFLDGLTGFVGLDFGLVLSSGCIFDVNFHGRMLFSTIAPLVALGLLGMTYGVGVMRNRDSSATNESAAAALGSVQRKHASLALLISFLVYSSVSSNVFRMFACETLDDGIEYLRADYTIECDSAKHEAMQIYAAFMILVYPIGIPALYAALLWSKRDVLKDGRRRRRGDGDLGKSSPTVLQLTADLWKPYTPERYYYEVVECARRVSLTGVVVFIFPNSAAQVAVTLLIAFAFFAIFEALAPYATRADAWLSRVGYIVVFLSLFQALLLKVDVSNERSDSQEVFGGVLLVANTCMVVGVVVEAIMTTRFVFQNGGKAVLEDEHPVVRSGRIGSTNGRAVEGFDMFHEPRGP